MRKIMIYLVRLFALSNVVFFSIIVSANMQYGLRIGMMIWVFANINLYLISGIKLQNVHDTDTTVELYPEAVQ